MFILSFIDISPKFILECEFNIAFSSEASIIVELVSLPMHMKCSCGTIMTIIVVGNIIANDIKQDCAEKSHSVH